MITGFATSKHQTSSTIYVVKSQFSSFLGTNAYLLGAASSQQQPTEACKQQGTTVHRVSKPGATWQSQGPLLWEKRFWYHIRTSFTRQRYKRLRNEKMVFGTTSSITLVSFNVTASLVMYVTRQSANRAGTMKRPECMTRATVQPSCYCAQSLLFDDFAVHLWHQPPQQLIIIFFCRLEQKVGRVGGGNRPQAPRGIP